MQPSLDSNASGTFDNFDLWGVLSTVILATTAFNFALRYTGHVNPELMEIIASSTRLERFAEAAGYYQPVAVPRVVTVREDAANQLVDVLDNDYDEDYGNSNYSYREEGLWIQRDSQVTNLTGDLDAVVSVNPTPTGTNESAEQYAGEIATHGEVNLDTSLNYQGPLSFEYEACDSEPARSGFFDEPGCATARINVTVEARNDLPQVQTFGVALEQDSEHAFGLSEFASNFQDPDQLFLDAHPGAQESPSEGYTLQSIGIFGLPKNGKLYLGESEVTGGRTFTLEEIPTLRYVPNPGYFGEDFFSWYGNDGIANSFFPDSVELAAQEVATPQQFTSTARVNLTINEAQAPDLEPLVVPTQTITVRRGETVTSEAVTATTDPSGTITSLDVSEDLPDYCLQSTPGENGNTLTCTPPINAPLGEQTFTVTATDDLGRTRTENFRLVVEDYLAPTVTLASDTPPAEVVIDKQVCTLATITNPNSYPLADVVARLTTDAAKAPFVAGTTQTTRADVTVTEQETEVVFAIPSLDAGETTEVSVCALPKVTDLSVIEATTFVTGSDKTSRDEVELNPPAKDQTPRAPLARTGGGDLRRNHSPAHRSFRVRRRPRCGLLALATRREKIRRRRRLVCLVWVGFSGDQQFFDRPTVLLLQACP